MRLHKLSMMNIGPYVGLARLDFSELGDVFLVCGKTGSGKTTIFDAVSYALYGTGISTRDIVSHFATPEDEVFVELEFEFARQRWRVRREPGRLVAKKKGSGTTERPQVAVLEKWSGSGWEPYRDKAVEVDAAVSGILGLSAEEFTKIVLLPQGEFQRFLEMNTKERTQILEKLFPVNVHGAVSELARTRAQEAELAARDLDARAAAMEARLGAEPEAALGRARAELESAKLAESAALAVRDAAQAAAQAAALGARAWAELDVARAERAGLAATAAEAASLQARLSRAEAGLGAASAVATATRVRLERMDAETSLGAAHDALALADARQPEADAAERRAGELVAELEAMDREAGQLSARTAAWERLAAARSRLAAAEKERSAAMAVRAAAGESVAAAAGALATLEAAAADADQLAAERAAAAALLEAARDAERLAAESELYAEELRALQARVDSAVAVAEAAGARQLLAAGTLFAAEGELESLRDEMAAGRLAERLEPGLPCPVCGSLEHPAPANKTPAEIHPAGETLDTAAAERFSAAEALLSAAKKAASAAQHEAAAAAATLAELQNNLSERGAAADRFAAAQSVTQASEATRAARERLGAAEAALGLEATRIKAAGKARSELERFRQLLDSATAAEASAIAEFSAAEASATETGAGAGDADPRPLVEVLKKKRDGASVERARLEAGAAAWKKARGEAAARASESSGRLERALSALLRAEADSVKALGEAGFDNEDSWVAASMSAADLGAARARVRERAAEESSAAARLDAAERSVKGAERPQIDIVQSALEAASSGYAGARLRVDEVARSERELASGLEVLAAARADRAELRVRGDRLVAMSKLLNGQTGGRHLSFKIFTLASYFSRVVARASARLRDMSDGRYDLRVAEGQAVGRGHVGLDLEVLDSFTGVARPASSLSGGEKFLASISLALGLSDVIVARAASGALDSIFIDEGFGSLDDETLDRAMVALDRVRGERVIGIVSHVAELRNRVPTRIEVSKSSVGSTLRVVR
ncbi:MAG: hypothetical protein A2Y38_02400 [Spirochaetes bacterium GWB1_59_5]|nr:MAG: hypothetical protein A2Y38_02400 [Spirochaetes bacterium GWB1_59_5]